MLKCTKFGRQVGVGKKNISDFKNDSFRCAIAPPTGKRKNPNSTITLFYPCTWSTLDVEAPLSGAPLKFLLVEIQLSFSTTNLTHPQRQPSPSSPRGPLFFKCFILLLLLGLSPISSHRWARQVLGGGCATGLSPINAACRFNLKETPVCLLF